jgi:hypothetical protein
MKKTRIFVVLAVVGALVIGFVSGIRLIPSAEAQSSGAQFSECFGATLYAMPGQELNSRGRPFKTLQIPSGWTPIDVVGPAKTVGVGSSTQGGVLVLCR